MNTINDLITYSDNLCHEVARSEIISDNCFRLFHEYMTLDITLTDSGTYVVAQKDSLNDVVKMWSFFSEEEIKRFLDYGIYCEWISQQIMELPNVMGVGVGNHVWEIITERRRYILVDRSITTLDFDLQRLDTKSLTYVRVKDRIESIEDLLICLKEE